MYKAYDEISPILGLRTSDPVGAATWFNISVQIAEGARECVKNPDWPSMVEAELARN
jgi:hypothetical protein